MFSLNTESSATCCLAPNSYEAYRCRAVYIFSSSSRFKKRRKKERNLIVLGKCQHDSLLMLIRAFSLWKQSYAISGCREALRGLKKSLGSFFWKLLHHGKCRNQCVWDSYLRPKVRASQIPLLYFWQSSFRCCIWSVAAFTNSSTESLPFLYW